MYLNLLEEKSKKLFLKLAYNLASADGNYSDEEKMMIAEYCREMRIDYIQEETKESVNEIVTKLNSLCGSREKKIIVFEIIGLAMIDNYYDKNERKIIDKMIDTFELGTEFCDKCENVLNDYLSLQNRIEKLVIS